MPKGEREPRLVNGLYRVDLQGKTLDALEKDGLPIYYYRNRAAATRHESGLSGMVAVYQEGILSGSYRKSWCNQLKMIAEENAKLQQEDPSWKIIAPPNTATAIEVAQAVYKQYGLNVLPWYTRVGDGSLIAGGFNPRSGADVCDYWRSDGSHNNVGVLSLAVPA